MSKFKEFQVTNRRIVIPVVIGLILLALLLILLLTRGQTPVPAEGTTAATPKIATHTVDPSPNPSLTSSALPPLPTETPLAPTPSGDDQGLLAAPVGLTGEPGNTVVRLVWQPVAGAVGYVVFRDEAQTPLNALVLTETSYLDIGLSNKRAYRYAVAAVDAQGQVGALSPLIAVTPGQ